MLIYLLKIFLYDKKYYEMENTINGGHYGRKRTDPDIF